MKAETWDVRDILDEARAAQQREDEWIESHEGALSASSIGGCLRKEKLRLMGTKAENEPTAATLRRWRWGRMYEDEIYRNALQQNRRPRREVELEVDVDGIIIRGSADFIFTEGVVEAKTTSAWEMNADHLPFQHLIQLGTYMHAAQRPGQILYATFHREWSFDFPSLPEMWEPWVREVGRLFKEHPGPDPLPFPPERMYCTSCPYVNSCPSDAEGPGDAELDDLQRQIVDRYLAIREVSTSASKREKEAKAAILGLKETIGQDENGTTRLRIPGRTVVIKEGVQSRTDYTALAPEIRQALPVKTIITNRITVKETDDE